MNAGKALPRLAKFESASQSAQRVRPPMRGTRACSGRGASSSAANDPVEAGACDAERWLLQCRDTSSEGRTAAYRGRQQRASTTSATGLLHGTSQT
jgi:hypothetical protein